MNETLRRKVSKLRTANENLIKLVNRSQPSSIQLNNSKNSINDTYIKIIPSEVEELVHEKASMAIQLDKITAKLNETEAENKIVRKLLQECRTLSFGSKHVRGITEGNINTTSIADNMSDNKSILDKQSESKKGLIEKPKMMNNLDRWYKLYQLMEHIASRKNFKDIFIASIT